MDIPAISNFLSYLTLADNVWSSQKSFIKYDDSSSSYQTPALKKQGQGPICEDIFFGITWAEDVKSRLKLRNACCYSVQNLFSSSLLSIKIKIYKTVILPLVLYGCETWFLTMRVAQDEGFRE